MSLISNLFPPANREAAVVAALRTGQQVLKATLGIGGAGYIVITATQLATLNLTTVLWAAGAIGASVILSSLLSGYNVLVNGLPDTYVQTALATVPVAEVTTAPAPITVNYTAPVTPTDLVQATTPTLAPVATAFEQSPTLPSAPAPLTLAPETTSALAGAPVVASPPAV